MLNNDDRLFCLTDRFPIPVEIFSPDGTTVFLNRALLELNNIQDAGLLVGTYNILKDPALDDQKDFRETVHNAFMGETVNCPFSPPIKDLMDRGIIKEKPYESAVMEVYFYPVSDQGKLSFVLCAFMVKNIYQGKPEVARAREYIDAHWKEKFDPLVLAKTVNISVKQLYNLFNKYAGMPPGEYYRKCKVDHIKEALAAKNLSINEVFISCGKGAYSKMFKEITGMTPTEFRLRNSVI